MKNGRLFELLYLLVEKRAVTAGELARRFEVSERTIYRDIDALSAAGIPVYTQKGQGGGIRLMDRFVLDRCLLSPAQQDEMLFALRAVAATGGTGGEEVLDRLSALFGREGGDWLEVDFGDWGSGTRGRARFALVKQSILSHRVLSFAYSSAAGRRTRRRVEPARLVFKAGCWYLQAFCLKRGDWRLFRLVRMEELALEEEYFTRRPAPPALEDPDVSPGRTVHLRLRFAPRTAYRVRDSFLPEQVRREESGCLLVECDFPDDQWIASFLLSFGDGVEVLSPGYWREILRREGEKISALYETGHTLSGFRCYSEGGETGIPRPRDKEDPDMEKRSFCQCCGMPLDAPEDRGTQADGSLSPDYCRYCWSGGAFTAPEAGMEDMIAFNLKYNEENGYPFGPQEEAERNMRAWFPTLKRWKQ